jgi:hypothetical protein
VIPKTEWHIVGEEVVIYDCDVGCSCQFNALPTHGFCEALVAIEIQEGHFGDTSLAGVIYAEIFHWDGAVHQGNGWRRVVFDEQSTPEQRAAIEALTNGTEGHPYFEIVSAMAPNVHHRLEHAGREPALGLLIDGSHGGNSWGRKRLRRPGPHDPAQDVVDLTQIVRALGRVGRSQRQVRRDKRPHLIGHSDGYGLRGTEASIPQVYQAPNRL